jgi:hypothetical protein
MCDELTVELRINLNQFLGNRKQRSGTPTQARAISVGGREKGSKKGWENFTLAAANHAHDDERINRPCELQWPAVLRLRGESGRGIFQEAHFPLALGFIILQTAKNLLFMVAVCH